MGGTWCIIIFKKIYFSRKVEEREREVDRRGRKNMIIFINIYFLRRVREREKWSREGDIEYNYTYKDLL